MTVKEREGGRKKQRQREMEERQREGGDHQFACH